MRSLVLILALTGCSEIPVPNSGDNLHQQAAQLVMKFNTSYHQNLPQPRIYYGSLDPLVLAQTRCMKRYGSVIGCDITFNTHPENGIDESYRMTDTLPHELGHYACAILENGDASLHDNCWHKYAIAFGLKE